MRGTKSSTVLQVAYIVALLLRNFGEASGDRATISAREIVEIVSEATRAQHVSRASLVKQCQCSLHACSNDMNQDGHQCTLELGDNEMCLCSEGMKLNLNRSYVRTPPGVDPNDLPPHITQSVCLYQGLDSVFRDIGAEKGFQTWTYFGSMAGIMRIWPGKPRRRGLTDGSFDPQLGNCRTYEPRLRPWFIAAVTSGGPKDVVILLDVSETMGSPAGQSTRLSIAKLLVENILEFMTIADHISILPFGRKTNALVADYLLKATPSLRANLVAAMNNLEARGRSNVSDAFSEAFKILLKSVDLEKTANCQTVIILVSDGHNCENPIDGVCGDGLSEVAKIRGEIENGQKSLDKANTERASIFTFSIGQDSHNALERRIACDNGGTWSEVTGTDDILHKLQLYISFLASRRKGDSIVWSSFYEDDSGLGRMTTATQSIFSFDRSAGLRGQLVGVVGHDVLVSQLGDSGFSYLSVLGTVTGRLGTCTVQNMTTCEMQVLRGMEDQCPEILSKSCHKLEATAHTYYSSANKRLSQGDAVEECKSLGGYLIELDSEEELSFASGLADDGGSWIGLESDLGGVWKWQASGKEIGLGKFWAPGYQDRDGFCASIDSRGTMKTGQRRLCDVRLPYICEFDSMGKAGKVCRADEVNKIGPDDDAEVPSLLKCLRENGLEEEVEKQAILENHVGGVEDRAVCGLGPPRKTEELLCCKDCPNRPEGSSESSSPSSSVVLLSLLVLNMAITFFFLT
ncbi:hypothetical protein BSKO_00783 [Bryopsis sp. KO-2023]|nr:hypothetical protein BSKO_00783 [Bryopsis sp. KO-2023]